jgi:hypothetical protein
MFIWTGDIYYNGQKYPIYAHGPNDPQHFADSWDITKRVYFPHYIGPPPSREEIFPGGGASESEPKENQNEL